MVEWLGKIKEGREKMKSGGERKRGRKRSFDPVFSTV